MVDRHGRLRILAPNYYGMSFVTPRESRHEIVRRPYRAPWRRLWRPLDAIAWGLRASDCDVIHSYNRIPSGRRPWVISFESWLPRTLSSRDLGLRRRLLARLASPSCKRILPMSDYARNVFTLQNAGEAHLADCLAKTEIVFPNVPLRATEPKTYRGGRLQVLFVGNDFAQKGGVAALRLAKLALELGLDLRLHLVSALRYGRRVFADCADDGAYTRDMELLDLPNVEAHGVLPNERVLELLATCDFLWLTSLDDTFGFSVVEAMSLGTPVIASNVCALPEIVESGRNGHVIPVPLNIYRKWAWLAARDWQHLDQAYDRFAQGGMTFLQDLAASPEGYRDLSAGAISQIRRSHEARAVGARLDTIYEGAVR